MLVDLHPFESTVCSVAGVLPQRRMQDLGDVNHLFLSSHRNRQKPRKALIGHSQGSLISWCVHVVFVECQGKLEELKH